ncbi:MAG: Gamma-aminobutyrate:alpha-ketoglutarate aminotransferase [uncultured Truepera sp.]|uniref:Gamma-aminobutyrate:alpha-ketoglutarate aminotransferase n=1 Tax=uncultured Truepera sp. TaxID=543023 RepID=A0A6J4VIL7_9DEIN|nr:MAG: Gamma-aminobutyrate:alpha-ketoglutarate aminotransferase [uncultured Truepera sp.]
MNNQSLAERRRRAVSPAAYSSHPIYPARAEGAYVWDADGTRYLDWSVGIAVMNVGHSHPRVIEAVKRQAETFQHLCFAVGMHESYIQLAEKLNAIAPGPSEKRTFLVNSGAEAVENAVKIARVATGRQGIVAFTHAFHGRTHMALSLTAKANPYKAGFAPRAAEVYRAQYPYLYRNPWGATTAAEVAERALAALKDQVKTTIGEGEVAAFMIEPVAGEGGFIPAPRAFLEGLQTYAKEIGALWIDDEVQAGMGRTGAWWTVDHYGLEPDLVCSAKALSSGFPLSAVVGKAEVMDKIAPGQLGSTFGGNPVSCAAALATLEVIEEEGLLERAREIGVVATEKLKALQKDLPKIGDVRGLGAMIGIEFVTGPDKTPDSNAAQAVLEHARADGLLLLTTGTYGNVIRLLPPLKMSDAELSEGLEKLEAALRAVLEPVAVGV